MLKQSEEEKEIDDKANELIKVLINEIADFVDINKSKNSSMLSKAIHFALLNLNVKMYLVDAKTCKIPKEISLKFIKSQNEKVIKLFSENYDRTMKNSEGRKEEVQRKGIVVI